MNELDLLDVVAAKAVPGADDAGLAATNSTTRALADPSRTWMEKQT